MVVTDIRYEQPILNTQAHKAAIRGLAWNTLKANFLYTGGGSNDRCLKLWNLNSKIVEHTVYTGSQICEVIFFPDLNEVITAHGFSSNNIGVWSGNQLEKIAELSGHSKRVLHCVKTNNSNQILSGSSDQSLRFWDLVPKYDDKYGNECVCEDHVISLFGQCDCYEKIKNVKPLDILYNPNVKFGKKGVYSGFSDFEQNPHPFYIRKKWNRRCKKNTNLNVNFDQKISDFFPLQLDQKENIKEVELSESEVELEIRDDLVVSTKESVKDDMSVYSFDNGRILDHCSKDFGEIQLFGKYLDESNNYF